MSRKANYDRLRSAAGYRSDEEVIAQLLLQRTDAGEAITVSRTALVNWKHGRGDMSSIRILALARVLKTDVETLLKGELAK